MANTKSYSKSHFCRSKQKLRQPPSCSRHATGPTHSERIDARGRVRCNQLNLLLRRQHVLLFDRRETVLDLKLCAGHHWTRRKHLQQRRTQESAMICALASATNTAEHAPNEPQRLFSCELTELIACVKRCIYKVQPRTHFFLVLRSKTCSRRRVPTRGVSGVAVVDRCHSTSRRSVAAARRDTLRTVFVMPTYLPRILSALRFETCTRLSIIAYSSHETKISLFCSIQPPIECARKSHGLDSRCPSCQGASQSPER